MLPFSFMELFFFLSLGITFVLILLIVYHFKQRITTMEHKSDTMFDIVQNLAKEISMMKSHHTPLSHPYPSAEFGGGMFMPPIFMHPSEGPMGFQMSEDDNEYGDLEPVVEELNGEENKDGETDGESEDSDDASDSDDESDSDDSIGEDFDVELCEIDNNANAMEMNNMCVTVDEDENFQKIKIEDDFEPVVNQDVNIDLEAQEIHLSRQETLVEEEMPVLENPVVPQEIPEESGTIVTSTQDDYKKMSTTELKKLVASKGNTPKEINKLKRQDLLKLLEKSV